MSISEKINPWQTAVTNACPQPGLKRLQKALDESCSGRRGESGMLFLSLSDQAGGFTGWLTDRLEEGLVQAWRLAAGGVTEWERWLAEDWCVTLSGDATEMFRCQSGNVSANGEHLQISHHTAEGWGRRGVTDERLTEKWGEFVTHTLNNKQWRWANTSLWIWLTEKSTPQ